MCGIAGIAARPGACASAREAAILGRALAHRGPDDEGFAGWSPGETLQRARTPDVADGARLALVHRRLSILDLGPGGWQPMTSADGRFALVFNGEIYNHVELRAQLEARGSQFASRSDTEVLLEALAVWGTDALPRLIGMFAFGFIDTVARRMLLARDPFGIKPLHHAVRDDAFVFASEIPALLAVLPQPPRADAERVYAYLRFGASDAGGATLVTGVQALPPAHYAWLDLDAPCVPLRPERFWAIDPERRVDLPFDEAAARVRERFFESVRLHLRSDVPVGVALSGGIDSSAIACSMRQLGGADMALHAFGYVADDPALSEKRWIDLAAGAAKATLHSVTPTADELAHDLDALVRAQGEPFASTSLYAQWRVFRLARECGISVTLDGQGADELFGGYRSHLSAQLAALLRTRRIFRAVRFARAALRLPDVAVRDLLSRTANHLLPPRARPLARRLGREELMPRWLDARWFLARGVRPQPLDAAARPLTSLRAHLLDAFTTRSLPALLRYEDRSSMAFSIESRVPFLEPRLVELAFALPDDYLIADDGTSKAVLRRALRGHVPDAILDRRDKIGFATPERAWLSRLGPWVDAVLAHEAAERATPLDLPTLRREWQDVLGGRARFDFRFWRCLNLVRWAHLFDVRFDT